MMATNKNVPAIRFKGFEEEWKVKKLGEIANGYYGGGTPSTSISNYWNGNIPWIQSSDLEEGDLLNVSIKKNITELGLKKSATKLIPENSIAIVTRVGVGKLCIVPFKFATSQDFFSLSKLNIDIFFGVFAVAETVQKELHAVQGTSIKGITKDELLNKEINVSLNIKEQQKIGNYFKELDGLIQVQEQKLEKVTNLKKAMLEKMFPIEGTDVPEIRFKGLVESWKKKTLGEVVNISSASRVHKNEWTTLGVPFFRSSDVVSHYKGVENTKAYISNALYVKLSSISGTVKKDDILITGGGSIGIPYLIKSDNPLYFKDADLLWVKNVNNINGYFLYTFFLTQVFRNYIESITHIGTISHYTIEQAKCTPITIPDPLEQQKIGTYFQNLDQLINQTKQKIEQLKQLKQALLQKMFV